MRPKEVIEIIRATIRSKDMPAIHLWGKPGVGKSDVCSQVAREESIGFLDWRLAMMDPSDVKGLPFPENGRTKWLPPQEFPTEGNGILLLDEINLAPPLVQAAAYQLVLDRRVGETVLGNGWHIIAAGNKAEHGANVFKMATPLRNRFIHIEFEHDIDDWRDWAMKNGIASDVIEFISFRPDKLFILDPSRHDNAFPTPRSWEFVSRIMHNCRRLDSELKHKLIEGTVGAGAALEFKGYLQIKTGLPDINEILMGKDHVAEQVDIAFALATSLVIRAKPEQFERLLQYSQKALTREVTALMIKLMIQRDKQAVIACPSWKKLSREYFDLLTFGNR